MNRFTLVVIILLFFIGLVPASYIFFPEEMNRQTERVENIDLSSYVDFSFVGSAREDVVGFYEDSVATTSSVYNRAVSNVYNITVAMADIPSDALDGVKGATDKAVGSVTQTYGDVVAYASSFISDRFSNIARVQQDSHEWKKFASNTVYSNDANEVDLLVGIEPAAGGDQLKEGDNPPSNFGGQYDIEDDELAAEAVLVPRSKTVVSSSRDGKIKKIHFDNGDHFKKGDVILEYYCDDLRAEMAAASAERRFAKQKELTTSRLFNMELSSDLELVQSKVEKEQAVAKKKVVEARVNDCVIRAGYDGRVVKRMANDNEYTRTDRVLMEIASKGTLDVEFLLPSKSLRWINLGAPISLIVSETDRQYKGKIKQIYGEVDPVSQSIQIRAGLDDYDEPLLPGMSGRVTIDIYAVREAGISGFLETAKR